MTGKKAVAKAVKNIQIGLTVRIWNESDDVKVYPEGFYVCYWHNKELCRGINGGIDVLKQKFLNDREAFIK